MDFFQNQATFYHFDKNNVTRIEFNNVYFRNNIISRSNSKGTEKGSSGSITIPTENTIEIIPGDYVIKGIIKFLQYITQLYNNLIKPYMNNI